MLAAASTSSSVKEFNDKGSWDTVTNVTVAALTGMHDGYTMHKTQTPKATIKHTSGVGSPEKNINPGGSYTKLDHKGDTYSYTEFDNFGRQTMRIDSQGKPHAGALPHTHIYSYPQQGGRIELIYDSNWKRIK